MISGTTPSRAMTARERQNRALLRARDTMDRDFAHPLDVPTLAAVAHVSPAHFTRIFKQTFGETPHRYLQRRRIERAMALLRDTATPVTEVAWAVGFGSLGTFSRTFREIVGVSPRVYRQHAVVVPASLCFTKTWSRPAG